MIIKAWWYVQRVQIYGRALQPSQGGASPSPEISFSSSTRRPSWTLRMHSYRHHLRDRSHNGLWEVGAVKLSLAETRLSSCLPPWSKSFALLRSTTSWSYFRHLIQAFFSFMTILSPSHTSHCHSNDHENCDRYVFLSNSLNLRRSHPTDPPFYPCVAFFPAKTRRSEGLPPPCWRSWQHWGWRRWGGHSWDDRHTGNPLDYIN